MSVVVNRWQDDDSTVTWRWYDDETGLAVSDWQKGWYGDAPEVLDAVTEDVRLWCDVDARVVRLDKERMLRSLGNATGRYAMSLLDLLDELDDGAWELDTRKDAWRLDWLSGARIDHSVPLRHQDGRRGVLLQPYGPWDGTGRLVTERAPYLPEATHAVLYEQ